jgi:hypothetical protein
MTGDTAARGQETVMTPAQRARLEAFRTEVEELHRRLSEHAAWTTGCQSRHPKTTPAATHVVLYSSGSPARACAACRTTLARDGDIIGSLVLRLA